MNTALSPEGLAFVTDRHLATLSTLAADGTIHMVPVGFTWDDGIVRIITSRTTQKVVNARRGGTATVGQVEGARWISFVGEASILEDPQSVADAEARYAARYRPPRPNPERVVIVIRVTRVLASSGLRAAE